jgi:hypothetical protein
MTFDVRLKTSMVMYLQRSVIRIRHPLHERQHHLITSKQQQLEL